MGFYRAIKTVISPVLKRVYKPWIRGVEKIPREGAAILASNHQAVWDSIFLPAMIDREVVFMGKSDYFTGKGVKGWAVRNFMKAVGTIPVDRSGRKAAEAAMQAGLSVLKKGQLFGIYPEGTRSPDGKLYRGKTGVARLALESGAPVIPVAMIGTHQAQPIGKKIPSRTNIGIIIGDPLDFSRYRALKRDRYALRAVTDEIMYSLMMLSGQEYVDRYAADVKAELAAAGKFNGPMPGGQTEGANKATIPALETMAGEVETAESRETPTVKEAISAAEATPQAVLSEGSDSRSGMVSSLHVE